MITENLTGAIRRWSHELRPRSAKNVVIEFEPNVVKLVLSESGAGRAPILKVKFLSQEGEHERLRLLRDLMRELQLKPGTRATILAPRSQVHVKTWRLPGQDENELRRMIGFRLQQELPLPLTDLVYDFRTLTEAEGQAQVLVVIARRREIESYLELCRSAGLVVEAVRLNLEAAYLCFLQSAHDLEGLATQCLALIDVDFSATNVYVIARGKLLFCRSLAQGVSTLIDRVAGPQRGYGYEDWLEELREGVSATLAALEREGERIKLDRAVLNGWLPRVQALAEALAEKLMIPVTWFEASVSRAHAAQSAAAAAQRQYLFSISAFLGVMASGNQRLVDLRPEAERKAQHTRTRVREGLRAALWLAYMIGLSLLVAHVTLSRKEAWRVQLQAETTQLRSRLATHEHRQKVRQAMLKQLGNVEPAAALLSQLFSRLPQSVTLSTLAFQRGESIVLRGVADHLAEVFDLPQALAQQPGFGEAVLVSVQRREREGVTTIYFEMKVYLRP
jgi:Tfp pilus assembly PilM family ATPase